MERSDESFEGSIGGLVERLARRTRSGYRVWSSQMKGRAVFESMKPGARVCEVAERYGVKPQQLTTWRRLARQGQIALVADEAADFVEIEVSEPIASCKAPPIEILIGRVSVRLGAEAPAARIAEIVTAIERGA
ncbi:MAG: transposase [Xanthobacteraceae bacterium]